MHRVSKPAPKPTLKRDPAPSGSAETDLRTVNAFAISLLQQTNLDELLWSMVESIGRLLGYEDCVIYLLEGDRLIQTAAYGAHAPISGQIPEPLVLRLGEGIAGTVAETGEALVVPDTREDPRYVTDGYGGLSELTVPILFEGRVLGIIDTERKEPGAFDDTDRDRLQWIANIAASRIASALAEREREKAEAALSKIHGEMKAQKLESLGTLAGGIAHDFNNLLTVVLGNINLAQRFVEAESREARVLGAAHEACLRARDLTKQLLIFASGGAPIKKTGSIGDLLRESVEFALHGSNVRAELDVADNLHAVEMDAGQIHAVVNGLVLNAIQAMPEGGVIEVRAGNTTTSKAGEAAVKVEIEDHGCGIPEENLEKIFDPYFTTKGSDGSGLGLSTAYKIVKEHGGTLGVRSRVDEGTTFDIRLPAVGDAVSRAEPAPPPAAHREGGEVLLMDDDASVRSSVADMLTHLGHRVTVAEDGEEALSLFGEAHRRGRPFSAVILDLTIPGGMGGKEVIPKLRDIEPDVKAIVASGYSNDPVMAEHELYGFQAVIEKPFDLAELDQVLSRLIA